MNIQEFAIRFRAAVQHQANNFFHSNLDRQVCVLAAHIRLEPLQNVSQACRRFKHDGDSGIRTPGEIMMKVNPSSARS